jgi:hypothetical protein
MFDTITLLGEVLWTGVLVSLASLPLVTMPAALAAGIRHMERHIDAREDGVRLFIGEVRRALVPGGVIVGLGLVALTGILALQSMVANVAGVPGAQGLGLAVLVLLWFLGTLVVEVCASWAPGVRWRVAMVDGAARLIGSPKEGALIALAVALTGIAVWQLPPLVIPALGCLAFAAAVVGVRRRRPEEEAPAEHR